MSGIADWLPQVMGAGWRWYVKYLSGNDTLANASHQAGPYIPRQVLFSLLPTLARSSDLNPRVAFPVRIDSAAAPERTVTAIWYNNRVVRDGTRNEARITNWGGAASPLLDPESTGALAVFAFLQEQGRDAGLCRVWICSGPEEEEILSDRVQRPIEPGDWLFFQADGSGMEALHEPSASSCIPVPTELPRGWLYALPEALALVNWTVQRLPLSKAGPDDRLLQRRACEFELYRFLEEQTVLPRIREGFDSVESFVSYAGAITNRRKSRSGRSLELHLCRIFDEHSVRYAHGAVSEGNKRPDFLFPSAEAYYDSSYPGEQLRMLAVKTTCKDRWRQVLNEADRVRVKHLLTLQEGVSPQQFAEMRQAGVCLVAPRALHSAYPRTIRPVLLSLENLLSELRDGSK